MITEIKKIYSTDFSVHHIILTDSFSNIPKSQLSEKESVYINKLDVEDEVKSVHFNNFEQQKFIISVPKKDKDFLTDEAFRKAGSSLKFQSLSIEEITIYDFTSSNGSLFFAEGMILGNYKFDKYKGKDKQKPLTHIFIYCDNLREKDVELMNISNQATFKCRDLSNEPQSVIDSFSIAKVFKEMCDETGITIEIFNKKKIESLKFGGILAVNKGSINEPTFSVMKWKPENAINKKPYIFVGKGVVFDTGGLNVKTGNSMLDMKIDMAGAAAVATAMWAISKAKLPVYAIALVPATDNRSNGNAYAPGDIIKMHNGKTVEIINTDAEGRMILADALSYASKFEPELVIDLATLTGSAVRAIGKYASAAMKNESCQHYDLLSKSGENVYERLVEFPMWDEYGDSIKSDFADIKNLGDSDAGLISAAKFLEHFVSFPWIHLDIAGSSILSSKYDYSTKGASGVGTRLLFDFVKKLTENKLD